MRRGFRILVITDVCVVFFYVISVPLFFPTIPEQVKPFAAELHDGNIDAYNNIISNMLGLITILTLVISWVGLFLFWNPARWMYLAAIVVPLLYSAFFSFTILPPVSDAIGILSALLGGAILALIFCSPIKKQFIKGKS